MDTELSLTQSTHVQKHARKKISKAQLMPSNIILFSLGYGIHKMIIILRGNSIKQKCYFFCVFPPTEQYGSKGCGQSR